MRKGGDAAPERKGGQRSAGRASEEDYNADFEDDRSRSSRSSSASASPRRKLSPLISSPASRSMPPPVAPGPRPKPPPGLPPGTDVQVSRRQQQVAEMLVAMGFILRHAMQAVRSIAAMDVMSDAAVPLCLTWLEQNPYVPTAEERDAALDHLITPLVTMGFSVSEAHDALERCNNSQEKAIELLLELRAQQEALSQEQLEQRKRREEEAARRAQIKREQAERRKREELERLKRSKPKILHYGNIVVMAVGRKGLEAARAISLSPQEGLAVHDGSAANGKAGGAHEDVAFSPHMDKRCLFALVNPDDLDDASPVLFGHKVALRCCSDGMYVSVEANGAVKANRDEPSTLAVWKLGAMSNDDGDDADIFDDDGGDGQPGEMGLEAGDEKRGRIKYDEVAVRVLSTTGHSLRTSHEDARGLCFANGRESDETAMWRFTFHSFAPRRKRVQAGADSRISCSFEPGVNAKLLWENLRRTFRLRAFISARQQIEEAHELVQREKNRLERMKKEENTCVICYENIPDSVLLECGHKVVCAECAPILEGGDKTCPICRSVVESVVVIAKLEAAKPDAEKGAADNKDGAEAVGAQGAGDVPGPDGAAVA